MVAHLKENGSLPVHELIDYKEEAKKLDKLEAKVNMLRKLKQKVFTPKELDEETKFYNKFMGQEYLIDDDSEQLANQEWEL